MKTRKISNELMESLVNLSVEEIHNEIKQITNNLVVETDQDNINNLEFLYEIYNDRIIELSFMTGNSIEKRKMQGGEYEYFVTDINGERIKDIGNEYYNPIEIGTLSEEFEDENDKLITQIYHRFYEFTYKDNLPKYKIELEDNGFIFYESIYDWDDDEEEQQWTSERTYSLNKGGEIVELKAIFDDNGEQIISNLISVDKYIPEIGFIVTLYHFTIGNYKDALGHYNGWWASEWANAIGEQKLLQCVINLHGKFIIEPWRSNIKYLDAHNLFIVGGIVYNHLGIRQDFSLDIRKSSLYKRQLDENIKWRIEIEKNEKYLIIQSYKNEKYGLIKNGEIIYHPRFDNLQFSTISDIFIVNYDNKFGFISADLIQGKIILEKTEIKFDELFELSTNGYLCKSISENKIYLFDGFSNEIPHLSLKFNTIDEKEVINVLKNNYSQNINIRKTVT